MYRRMLIILLSFLLIGCGSQDDIQALKDELETMNNNFQMDIDKANQVIIQLRDELEVKDKVIQDQKGKIDDLSKRVMKLEKNISNFENDLMSLEFQAYYNDYLTEFINDIVREFDDYSTIRGMIIDYDAEENLVEIDVLEYVAYYDEERIEELNIDTENEPIISGSYIYNAVDDNRIFKTNESVKIHLHRSDDPGNMINGSVADLISMIQKKPRLSYTLHLVNGVVIRITEDFHN